MDRLPTVVVLGMFDGVHIGHRKLVETARAMADRSGFSVTVYTFSNHPMELLRGSASLLSDNTEREALLKQAGADAVYMEPFTKELCSMPPEDFLKHLNELFDVRGIVCGFNYTYGAKGAGKPEMLETYGRENGIDVEVVAHCDALGAPVSSTRIRNMLAEGETASALTLLGHPFYLAGTVTGKIPAGGYRLSLSPNLVVPYPRSYKAVEKCTGTQGILKSEDGEWTFCPAGEADLSGELAFRVSGEAQ